MTPLVMVELLPNDPNIKKDHYWWFVPLPIADIQVPSSIQIIQLFNCFTSETENFYTDTVCGVCDKYEVCLAVIPP